MLGEKIKLQEKYKKIDLANSSRERVTFAGGVLVSGHGPTTKS